MNKIIEKITCNLKEVGLYDFVEFLRTYPRSTESLRVGDKCYVYKDSEFNVTIACWKCTADQHYWIWEEENEKERSI